MTNIQQTTAQHRAVAAAEAEPVADDRRPTPGPIAIMPTENALFEAAVGDGGGVVEPLGNGTRGLIWHGGHAAGGLAEVLAEHPEIEWVQLPSAGVDSYGEVFRQQSDRPLPLWTSAKGAYSQPVAEHALTLTLALLRVLPKRIVARSWATKEEGTSLFGLHVLIVGAGGVAVEMIRLLEPFGVAITVVRRKNEPVAGAARVATTDELLDLLPEIDVVVIAAAFTAGTSRLFGEREFAAMKNSAVLVNIARGGLIDTDALTAALASGEIAGAGLDVTDPEPLPDGHPLWAEQRAIITPHSADTPEMTNPLLAERIRENVVALLGDGRFVGIVDPTHGY